MVCVRLSCVGLDISPDVYFLPSHYVSWTQTPAGKDDGWEDGFWQWDSPVRLLLAQIHRLSGERERAMDKKKKRKKLAIHLAEISRGSKKS